MATLTRKLGRTTLQVSEIGFGCGTSAGLMIDGAPENRRAAVARALERGITLFDTAPVYGDGRSETHLGEALRSLGATPVVATKVALELADCDDIAGAIVRSLEGSLERLGLDVLPLVHMHNRVGRERNARAPFGSGALLALDDVLGSNGVVAGFARAKARGLVQHVGCQAYGGDRALIEALIDSDAFDSIIVNYSLLNVSAWIDGPVTSSAFDYGRVGARAASRGMGIIALRVLEAGALATGFARHPIAADPGSPDFAAHVDAARSLRFLVDDPAATLVAPAIRFALGNPHITSVLVGISNAEQIDEAADAARSGSLAPEQLERIERLRENAFRG